MSGRDSCDRWAKGNADSDELVRLELGWGGNERWCEAAAMAACSCKLGGYVFGWAGNNERAGGRRLR